MEPKDITLQRFVCSSNELVENMIVPLIRSLGNNARFLKEIPLDIRTGNIPVVIKLDTNEFSLLSVKLSNDSTNREELLFLTVCAFPKASRMGLACRICCSRLSASCGPEAIAARYCMTFLVFSVFPAPDSPLHGQSLSNGELT